MTCPGCGEDSSSQLPIFNEEGTASGERGSVVRGLQGRLAGYGGAEHRAVFSHIRIEACDTCRRYLLNVDLASDPKAVPRVDEDRKDRLVSIKGLPPDLSNPPPGCKFHPRCPFVIERCKFEEPPLDEVDVDQVARCWVLMRNVNEQDIATAKTSSISVDAAQKLKTSAADSRGPAGT